MTGAIQKKYIISLIAVLFAILLVSGMPRVHHSEPNSHAHSIVIDMGEYAGH